MPTKTLFDDDNLELAYGTVRLKRLDQNLLETVRNWRNSEHVAKHMHSSTYISPQMQEQWFSKAKNSTTAFYFVIFKDSKPLGLASVVDIDFDRGTCSTGMYIGDKKYLNTGISIEASIALGHFIFDVLCLKKIIVSIKKDNKRAIRYNTIICGASLIGDDPQHPDACLYELIYENHKK